MIVEGIAIGLGSYFGFMLIKTLFSFIKDAIKHESKTLDLNEPRFHVRKDGQLPGYHKKYI